jgi:hypothetical protein
MAQSHIGFIRLAFLGKDQTHFSGDIYACEIKQACRAERLLPSIACTMVFLATIQPFDSQLSAAGCRSCIVDYRVASQAIKCCSRRC